MPAATTNRTCRRRRKPGHSALTQPLVPSQRRACQRKLQVLVRRVLVRRVLVLARLRLGLQQLREDTKGAQRGRRDRSSSRPRHRTWSQGRKGRWQRSGRRRWGRL